MSRGRVGLCHYSPSVSVVQRDTEMSFLTQRQAESPEITTAGGGKTQKPPVPRPPQPEAMPPLPTPSRTRSLSAAPPTGHSDPRSLPACPRRSEIEPGRSLRPGEAQSHTTVRSRKHLWRSSRPSARPSASFLGKAGRALPPYCSPHPAAEAAHSPRGPGFLQRPPAPSAPAHRGCYSALLLLLQQYMRAPGQRRHRPPPPRCQFGSGHLVRRLLLSPPCHLPPSLPLSLRTARPFLRPPSPAAGAGWDGEIEPSHGLEPETSGWGSYHPFRGGHLALRQGRSPMPAAFRLSGGVFFPLSHLLLS